MRLPVNYNKLDWRERKSVREKYIEDQDGKCHFCNRLLSEEPEKDYSITKPSFPPNFFKYPIHLHHDHETGMTIRAVHCYCNAVLWEYFGE